MRSISPLVSFVIVVGILTVGLALTWRTLFPAYQRAREGAILMEAMSNIRTLNLAIKEVRAEGIGAARRIPLRISEGSYVIDVATDTIEFVMRTQVGTLEPGLYVVEDEVKLLTGWTASAEENATHFLLEGGALRVVLRKATNALIDLVEEIELKLTGQVFTPSNSTLTFDADPALSVGTIDASLVRKGKRLARAMAQYQIGDKRVLFTVPAASDYVEVTGIGNFTNFTFNMVFRLGATDDNDYIVIPGVYEANVSNFTAGTCDFDGVCEFDVGETPACNDCSCWDARTLLTYWVCAHDEELTPTATLAMVHLEARPNFLMLCYLNVSQQEYGFNLTGRRKFAFTFTTGDCDLVAKSVEWDEYDQWLPPSIATLPVYEAEEYEIMVVLDYEKIDLLKGGTLRAATPYACIRYAGFEVKPQIEVWPC